MPMGCRTIRQRTALWSLFVTPSSLFFFFLLSRKRDTWSLGLAGWGFFCICIIQCLAFPLTCWCIFGLISSQGDALVHPGLRVRMRHYNGEREWAREDIRREACLQDMEGSEKWQDRKLCMEEPGRAGERRGEPSGFSEKEGSRRGAKGD